MNTPTHFAFGACLAYALATAVRRSPGYTQTRAVALVVGCLAVGALSHVTIDLVPHYNWIVYLDWFKPLPFNWLISEALFGLAVAIPALIIAGRAWPFVALGMFGAIYPDIEKVLSVDLHVPARFLVFRWHSERLSDRTTTMPPHLFIAIECLLIVGFVLAMWAIRRRTDGGRRTLSRALS